MPTSYEPVFFSHKSEGIPKNSLKRKSNDFDDDDSINIDYSKLMDKDRGEFIGLIANEHLWVANDDSLDNLMKFYNYSRDDKFPTIKNLDKFSYGYKDSSKTLPYMILDAKPAVLTFVSPKEYFKEKLTENLIFDRLEIADYIQVTSVDLVFDNKIYVSKPSKIFGIINKLEKNKINKMSSEAGKTLEYMKNLDSHLKKNLCSYIYQ